MSMHKDRTGTDAALRIALTVLTLSNIVGGSPIKVEDLNLAEITKRTLARWQAATGVVITPDAASAIVNSVIESRPELDCLLLAQSPKSDPALLTQNLIRHYCFNLRDSMRGLEVARPAPASAFSPVAARRRANRVQSSKGRRRCADHRRP